jgi:hypothetical protein
MPAPKYIQKTEAALISSLGTVFTHGFLNPDGTSCTPAGSFGETRIVLRSCAAGSAAVTVSLSDSIKVTVQSMGGNNVLADIICQQYHSMIA